MDGPSATPEGAWDIRAYQLPRWQAELSQRHSSLRNLRADGRAALRRIDAARATARRTRRRLKQGRLHVLMKALILAAGRGERMRPLTDTVPKPLLKAGGRRLIEWQIDGLARAGVRDVVINTAHLPDAVEQTLGDGGRYGV